MRSLISVFASRFNILWVLSYWLNIIWSFLALNEAAQARMSLSDQAFLNIMPDLDPFCLTHWLFSWKSFKEKFKKTAGDKKHAKLLS